MEDEELDEEIVANLCMYMRVVDFFDKNLSKVEDNPEMIENIKELNSKVKLMMDLLTEEQQDYILEEYRLQKEEIERMEKEKKQA